MFLFYLYSQNVRVESNYSNVLYVEITWLTANVCVYPKTA